ncbi:hypothetical protein LguiB_006432 [Lonicera macranthoides]
MAKATMMLCFLSLLLCAVVCSGKTWCIVRVGVPNDKMQGFIDFVCSQLFCGEIQPGGGCYLPNTLANHVSYCLNIYYRVHNVCNPEIGNIAINDPSFGRCHYN